jgi:hypothetical protein
MSLSSILTYAASHRTGGARSFPTSRDESMWLNYAYDAPDQAYAKLFFRHVHGNGKVQPAAAAKPAAGWVIPSEGDTHPVLVANSLLANIWLLREMLPAALSDDHWQQLADAAQLLSNDAKTPPPPPSAQRPAAVQMEEDIDSTLGASDSESDLDPVRPQKRKEPPASLEPAQKRVCTPSSAPSPAPPDDTPGPETPRHVITVTNNNRRSDVRIQKNLGKAQEKRKLDLGLLPPAKSASAAEKLAYSNVAPPDIQHLSWLFKQPAGADTDLYHAAASPYRTASDMLTKARAVGHPDAWSNAASFLGSWRQHGTPFFSQEPAALSQRQPRSKTAADLTSFQHVWKMCDYYEGQLLSAIIKYRWAMALLRRAYATQIAHVQHNDAAASSSSKPSRKRNGKGQIRTEAIDDLLRAVSGANPSKQERDNFRRRLSRASRWYTAATILGWGSLCLMPSDAISNTWAERKLTSTEWRVWLDLVSRIQPDACTASRKLDAWLGADGIQGGSIQDKETLCIEQGPAAVVGEVEEVADSDMESESGVDSDGEEATAGAPCRPLRQLTLLELFVPKE